MRNRPQETCSTRCRISHRPAYRTSEPVFYRCEQCGSLIVLNAIPDGQAAPPEICCCGEKMPQLQVCKDPEILKEHEMAFTVYGGFEKNAVRISVDGNLHPMRGDHRIEWMYLRTYQGGILKYLPEGGRSVANFALGDEDAYVYCDRDVCRMGREHCQFVCKRGNIAYAYCSRHGLMRLELNGF